MLENRLQHFGFLLKKKIKKIPTTAFSVQMSKTHPALAGLGYLDWLGFFSFQLFWCPVPPPPLLFLRYWG